jgi:hypothetical protein
MCQREISDVKILFERKQYNMSNEEELESIAHGNMRSTAGHHMRAKPTRIQND